MRESSPGNEGIRPVPPGKWLNRYIENTDKERDLNRNAAAASRRNRQQERDDGEHAGAPTVHPAGPPILPRKKQHTDEDQSQDSQRSRRTRKRLRESVRFKENRT